MRKKIMVCLLMLIFVFNSSLIQNIKAAEKKRYEFITPCQWEYINIMPDCNGIYYARDNKIYVGDTESDRYHYLFDRYGNLIYKTLNDSVSKFSDGLALVHHNAYIPQIITDEWKKEAKYFYIDTKGNTVLPMIYTNATDFYNGFAVVQMYNEENDTFECFRINTHGERQLLNDDWDEVSKNHNNSANNNYKTDSSNNYSHKNFADFDKNDFGTIEQICDGRAVVTKNGRYGVIRWEDDGEIYDFKKNVLGTAYNSTVYINNQAEHAYKVGEDLYIDVRLLENYGLFIKSDLNGEKLFVAKRLSKIPYDKEYKFKYKDSYDIYDSIGSVYFKNILVESKNIDGNMSVNIKEITKLNAAVEGNQIIINSPYMELEGITWEWMTEPMESVDTSPSNGYYCIRNGDDIVYYKDGIILDTKPDDWEKQEEYPLLVNEGRHLKSGPNSNTSGPYSLGTYKYYDKDGNLLLDDNWTVAEPFENGYASVNYGAEICYGITYEKGLWGVIDTEGNYMTEPKWIGVKMFSDQRMLAYSQEKRGLLDKDENELITFTEDNKSLKDRCGNIILSADHIYISDYYPDDECLIVKTDSKEGIIKANGDIVFPFLFYPIFHFGKNIYHIDWDALIRIKKPEYLQGNVYYNNKRIDFSQKPLIVNDRTMIPVRALFEEMGFRVTWYGDSKTAVIENDNTLICLFDGRNGFYSNEKLMYSDTAVINYKDRIYLPLRAVSEAINKQVDYDSDTGNIYIY